MSGAPQSDPFRRLLSVLEPWLGQIVIVGGRAHQLYRLHPRAQDLDYSPLATLDADVAVPAHLEVGEDDIRTRLLAHGFTEDFCGEDHPPATHYQLGGEASGFYAEFLTPLIGSELDRGQKRKTTTEIAGVVSQRLRHVELLLHQPWSIVFEFNGITVPIQIANPVSFLVQKILIHRRRGREDRAKDILYMHDTLEVFGARLSELRDSWRSTVAPRLSASALSAVLKAPDRLFGALTDDIRRAARISTERALSPESIREACRFGFAQVLE
jgi:hypothetical protein